jgi:hypothetical protein
VIDIAVFDPGMTTGFVLAEFDTDVPVSIVSKRELPGGLETAASLAAEVGIGGVDRVVSERFRMTPRVRTQVQVEPLRIEGAIEAWCRPVVWQWPDQMLLAGAGHGSPSRNKTAADNILRAMGLWTLPSEVDNHPDANDINSAMKHLVAYLRNIGHEPTLEALRNAMR